MTAAKSDWCPTTATDARRFFYNPDYIGVLTIDETQFMLAHEALHCALSHFARRGHRVRHRWDLACDFAINPLLVDDGLKPPPNALLMPEYQDMTAEEIYPLIDDSLQQETLDTHAYDRDSTQQDMDTGMREHELSTAEQARMEREDESGGSGDQPEPAEAGAESPPPLTPDERETLNIQWRQRMAGAAQQAKQAGKGVVRVSS